jgi:hypothetical protein
MPVAIDAISLLNNHSARVITRTIAHAAVWDPNIWSFGTYWQKVSETPL